MQPICDSQIRKNYSTAAPGEIPPHSFIRFCDWEGVKKHDRFWAGQIGGQRVIIFPMRETHHAAVCQFFCKLAMQVFNQLRITRKIDYHAGVIAQCIQRVIVQCLALTRDGRVRYALKTLYRDSTTHVIFEPLDITAITE